MTSFVSKNFNIWNAQTFAASFAKGANYLYIGRATAWEDDDNPPVANDTVAEYNKIWDNMAGAVYITPDRVTLGIKRNDWSSGKTYERYEHANSTSSNFYVLAGSMDRDI